MNPPGSFDCNTSFEQVQNLCWKLALSLQHCASPKLLETFHQESRSKTQEAIQTSNEFINFIGDYYKAQEEAGGSNLNASHTKDFVHHLQKYKDCFVGITPYTANMLNYDDGDLLREESINFSLSTPSFEFVAPSSAPLNPATSGSLAPNAKLKPYTLFQLLLTSASPVSVKPPLTATLSSQELVPTTSTTTEEKPKKKSLFPKNQKERQRSNSVSAGTSHIWSVLPLFQKGANSPPPKKRPSVGDVKSSNTTTPASVLISAERWKSIKTNHINLLDCIQSLNQNGCTFTILIFSGGITKSQEKTRHFVKLLTSSASFFQRYERAHENTHRTSIAFSDPRSSISSTSSKQHYYGTRKTSLDQPRPSFDQPPRSSFDSVHSDTNRFSMSTMSSSTTFHHPSQQQPLFSLLFVSNATRSDAVHYLNNTPPATVHSTFPCGLTQVLLDHDGQCYRAYNIKQDEVIVIRPDGYIGTRLPMQQPEECFQKLNLYFDSFLRPPVDMSTAAAVVAAGFD